MFLQILPKKNVRVSNMVAKNMMHTSEVNLKYHTAVDVNKCLSQIKFSASVPTRLYVFLAPILFKYHGPNLTLT